MIAFATMKCFIRFFFARFFEISSQPKPRFLGLTNYCSKVLTTSTPLITNFTITFFRHLFLFLFKSGVYSSTAECQLLEMYFIKKALNRYLTTTKIATLSFLDFRMKRRMNFVFIYHLRSASRQMLIVL